jgi:hypothetical protein
MGRRMIWTFNFSGGLAWAATERKGMETLVFSDIGSGLKASRRQLQRLFQQDYFEMARYSFKGHAILISEKRRP